jgi:hypothetical protein
MANQVASALLRSARSYAGQLSSLVKSFAPNHLKDNVHSHAEEVSEGVVRIHVEVSGPDAHAQEYGSGLHTDGRKGAKAKYPITPKPGTAFLEFLGTNQFDGWLIRTQLVMHPGIKKYKGKGYVAPAIKELRAKIKQRGSGVRQEIRQAILGEIQKSFMGAKKK